MKTISVSNYNYNPRTNLNTKKINNPQKQQTRQINFGWCVPHLHYSETLNKQFEAGVKKILDGQKKALENIENLNKLKQTRYSLLDDTAAKATQMFSQYCNKQYTVAELLPTYALSLNKSLIPYLQEMLAVKDPINNLIAINNVTKLNVKSGIDKHTGKEYTKSQVEKAKSGTQLYTTVMLMQLLNQNTEKIADLKTKEKVSGLISILNNSLDKIYGQNTYDRIIALSNIGSNPSHEQKVASLNLIQEFDEKGKELNFGEEFENQLQSLLDYVNEKEGKNIENVGKGVTSSIGIKLSYHTHATQEHGHEHSHLDHHHPHGPMSEEEHRLYHLQQEKLEQEKRIHNKENK